MNGIFAIDKPAGISSAKILAQVQNFLQKTPAFQHDIKIARDELFRSNQKPRKKLLDRANKIKIGHGGTLDVGASGVLVVGVGRGTKKLQHYLTGCTKTYVAEAVLGVATTSGDFEGELMAVTDVRHIGKQDVLDSAKKFTGDLIQTPPIYSALKVNGKPLYEYAREGKPLPIPIKQREVKVFDLKFNEASLLSKSHNYKLIQPEFTDDTKKQIKLSELSSINNLSDDKLFFSKQYMESNNLSEVEQPVLKKIDPDDDFFTEVTTDPNYVPPMISFEALVSSGTYIRTLISDIGKSLCSSAYMTNLHRTKQAEWVIGKNVFEISDFEKYPADKIDQVLVKIFTDGADIDIKSELENPSDPEQSSSQKNIPSKVEENINNGPAEENSLPSEQGVSDLKRAFKESDEPGNPDQLQKKTKL